MLNEGEFDEYFFEITGKEIHYINITLEWTDEDPLNRFYQNRADTFKLDLFDPDGIELSSTETELGIIRSVWPGENNTVYTGEFRVVVTLITAGEQEPTFGPGYLTTVDDVSNAYKIIIKYESYIITEETGSSADVRW